MCYKHVDLERLLAIQCFADMGVQQIPTAIENPLIHFTCEGRHAIELKICEAWAVMNGRGTVTYCPHCLTELVRKPQVLPEVERHLDPNLLMVGRLFEKYWYLCRICHSVYIFNELELE